jgi:intraflagellar transport protein 56
LLQPDDEPEHQVPTWSELVEKRDFLGAVTLLQVKQSQDNPLKSKEWLAYSHFHAGQYAQACEVYAGLLTGVDPDPQYHAYKAACYFYMGKFELAEECVLKAPESPLQNRILMHCAHASGAEEKLVEAHNKVSNDTLYDQLSLAAIHFRRSHFQEATDIYKKVLLENKTHIALNMYIALCYSRLDYYDISQEILKVILKTRSFLANMCLCWECARQLCTGVVCVCTSASLMVHRPPACAPVPH